MATDNLNELFGIPELNKQLGDAKKVVDDWVTYVTAASQKTRKSEWFVNEAGTLTKSTEAIKAATAAIREQAAANKQLYDAKKQELDLEARAATVRANEAKVITEQTKATLNLAKAQTESTKQSKESANAKLAEAKADTELIKQMKIELEYNIALQKEQDRLTKLKKQEEEQLKKNQSEYYQMNQRYKESAKAALDLGARLGADHPQFVQAAADVKKMSSELYALESAIGRNQRNVGNYKSAFDGLGNAINQISRELPAFTNSMTTGFMAISNNIPILIDQITALKAKNAELAAAGQATVPIMTQIAGAVFSWQTALSLAVTAVTMYGPDIIDFFMETDKEGKKAAETMDKLATETEKYRKEVEALGQMAFNDTKPENIKKSNEELRRQIDLMKAKGANQKDIIAAENQLSRREIADIESKIKAYEQRETSFIRFDKEIVDLKQKKADKENEIEVRTASYNRDIREKETKEHEEWLKRREEALARLRDELIKYSNELKNPADSEEADAPGKEAERLKKLKEVYDKLFPTDSRKSGLFDQGLSDEKANQLNIELELVHDNNKLKFASDKEYADKKKALDKELADNKIKLGREMFDALVSFGNALMERESRELDKRMRDSDLEKEEKLAYIESLNISDQERRDKRYVAEQEAFSREKELEKEKEKLERSKFYLKQGAALAEIAINTAISVAKIEAEAAILAAAVATAPLAAVALSQIPVVLAGAALAAGVVAAQTVAYADGTPVGGHPGGPAIFGEAGPEKVRMPGGREFIATEATYMRNAPVGMEVTPLHKMSIPDILMLQSMLPMANHYNESRGISDTQVNRIVSAISSQPVSSISLENGFVSKTIRRGNTTTKYIKRNIVD